MEEKGKGKSRDAWRWIVVIILIAAVVLCLVRCSGGCVSNATTPVVTTQPLEETTAPTEADTTTTEPEVPTDNITPAPVETLPQETTPSESTPPATEVKPSEPTTTESAHTHNYSVTNTVSPTCTAQGYTTFICSCGSSYQSNVTQATGHSWGAWTITKEATTSAAGEQIRTCTKCGTTESQAIAQLPAETPTEPAGCQHSWDMKWYPEQGHYGDSYVVCKCGYRCSSTEEWIAHTNTFFGEELVLNHGNYGDSRDYIIDSPERYEWICSKCGAVTDTQP